MGKALNSEAGVRDEDLANDGLPRNEPGPQQTNSNGQRVENVKAPRKSSRNRDHQSSQGNADSATVEDGKKGKQKKYKSCQDCSESIRWKFV